jgi:AraC family transcriptional activator FtrA
MTVVAMALSEGVPIFELAAPCAIFGTDRSGSTGGGWYGFRVCGPQDAKVDKWFRAATEYGYDALAAADTVIVPACHDDALNPPADLVDAVRTAYLRGARIASICTGAFVLGAAGILDNRRCTTHWLHAAELARRHPTAEVDPAVLYVDGGQVLTSAGKAAGNDLCLHIVRSDYGAAVANDVARRLVTAPHRDGGQAQYIGSVETVAATDPLGPVLDWAIAHLDQPITVDQLARHAHLGVRTLNRHFHAKVGASPLTWLHQQRVRRAQELLETTDDTIDLIAEKTGFGTSAALRRHFARALATGPDAYRRTFRILPHKTRSAKISG